MRILAVCGSLQSQSGNLALLHAAVAQAPDGVEIEIFDSLGELPHFNPDHEGSRHAAVQAWRAALAGTDAVLIATPEYAHSMPGALKNAIDWVIGSNELYRKVVAITCSVAGGQRGRMGLAALAQTLRAVDAAIVWDEPIARGPDAEGQLGDLLRRLAERVRSGAG